MATLGAQLGCEQYLASTVVTGSGQRSSTLLAELCLSTVLVLALLAFHCRPRRSDSSLTLRCRKGANHPIIRSPRRRGRAGAVAHRDHRFGGFELVHPLLAIAHAHTLPGTACISSASAALKLRSPGAAPL